MAKAKKSKRMPAKKKIKARPKPAKKKIVKNTIPKKTPKKTKAIKKPKPVKAKKIKAKPKPVKKQEPKLMLATPPSVPLLTAEKPVAIAPTQKPEMPKPTEKMEIKPEMPPPEKPAANIAPEPPKEVPKPPISGSHAVSPALELLPDWEDRLRLRRAIFEDGLEFFSLGKGSEEFNQAFLMLKGTKKANHSDLHDYFLICAKDRSGKIVGAIDGSDLSPEILLLSRSAVVSTKKRELHILLYAAALSERKPSYVVAYEKFEEFSVEFAAKLIFLGRGLGMSAIPLKTSHLIFIRRIKKELNPLSSGPELAKILEPLTALGELELGGHIDEIAKMSQVALILLPTSPDSREHLHELRDVLNGFGLNPADLENVMETLRSDYVLSRKDITPDSI